MPEGLNAGATAGVGLAAAARTYHVPTLMKEVKEIIAKARTERSRQTTSGR